MEDQFKPSEALEHEHQEIDEQLADFGAGLEEGEWRHDAFNRAATELRRHIYIEEEFLFPRLREAGLIPPVMVMVREHGEIWRGLDDLAAAAGRGDVDEARSSYAGLMATLGAHNAKEEQILYPASDQILGSDDMSRLNRQLDASTLPAGWLCETLR